MGHSECCTRYARSATQSLNFLPIPVFEDKKHRVDEFAPTNDIGDGKADGDLRYGTMVSAPGNPDACCPSFCQSRFRSRAGRGAAFSDERLSRRRRQLENRWPGLRTASVNSMLVSVTYGVTTPKPTDMVFKMKGVPCSPAAHRPALPRGTLVQADLVNDRTNIFAAHFNYPIGDPFGIPIKSAMRGEFAFYPDKPYNISEFPGAKLCDWAPATGALRRAGPSCEHSDNLVEKNTIRYALGFDRSTFIPFLQDDPWRALSHEFANFPKHYSES